jgi:hypothetical protein
MSWNCRANALWTPLTVAVLCMGCVYPPSSSPSSRKVPPTPGAAPSEPSATYRHCDAPQDCEVAWLRLDCCGSARATGVKRGQAVNVEAADKAAKPAAPSCECLAAPTQLDDGQTAEGNEAVGLACRAHTCTTYAAVPPVAPSTPAVEDAPIPCKRTYDCWVSEDSPPRPIARPKGIQHRFQGCVDGEVPPVCRDGICSLGFRFGC